MNCRSVIPTVESRVGRSAFLAPLLVLSACAITGSATNFTAVVADDVQCRTSSDNAIANMPGTAVAFTRGGTDDASVVVSFEANWPNPTGGGTANGAFILLEIDGARRDVTSTNGGVLVSPGQSSATSSATHGSTFVTEPIAPGSHTAVIRWSDNVLSGTGTICVAERSVVVFHD